jgi:hypothetical protein
LAALSLFVLVSLPDEVELDPVESLLDDELSPLVLDPVGSLLDDELSLLELDDEDDDDSPLRLSVTYQPLPLKTIAGAVKTRRALPEHSGQVCSAGASNPSRFSYT